MAEQKTPTLMVQNTKSDDIDPQLPQFSSQEQQTPFQRLSLQQQPPAVLAQEVDPKDMKMEVYSEKSFVIRGENTKLYTLQLTQLGGKWNKNLRGGGGWIFSNKKLEEATTWIKNAKSGFVQPDNPEEVKAVHEEKRSQYQARTATAIPGMATTPIGTTNPDMQLVQWTMFRPRVDMKAKVKVGQIIAEYEVGRTEIHNNIVDTVFIHPSGQPDQQSKLVICNGSWKVWGYAEEHSVFFSS